MIFRRLLRESRIVSSPRKRRSFSLVIIVLGFFWLYYVTWSSTTSLQEENPERRGFQRGILNANQDARSHSTSSSIGGGVATTINKEKSTSSQTLSKTHDDVSVTVEARGTHKVEPRGTHKVEPVASLGVESMDKNCSGPWPNHSQCEDKMQWMFRNWKSDECYARYGVDGSSCSFQQYLSEVESSCPRLHPDVRKSSGLDSKSETIAVPRLELGPLEKMLAANKKFKWISNRILSHWGGWVAGHKMRSSEVPANFTRRNILLYSGVLSDKGNHHYAEGAFKGGPLGELVQWADLITSVYILGHTLTLSTETSHLSSIIGKQPTRGCPMHDFDIIYIDIVGLRQFRDIVKDDFPKFRCKFRVLDTFGTEPQFNFREWKPQEFSDMKDKGHEWGNWNLNPRQTMTLYPHTPDNSFLGFVVGEFRRNRMPLQKENIAVVYGKELYMWKDKQQYLDVIHRHLEIHGTIGKRKSRFGGSAKDVPSYVVNHGVLKFDDLQSLLKRAKLFIGLGFPYEGPAPLEAISHGCYFLNPRISPPLNRRRSEFMKVKPTLRAFTSQNPYAERFIGKPHVYTMDMKNLSQVEKAMADIMKEQVPPEYISYEFTYEGMLERVSVYQEHQDFCSPHQWPTEENLMIRTGRQGSDCKTTCYDEGFVCEPEFFPLLNTEKVISRHFNCSSVTEEHSYHGPSYGSGNGHCSLQKNRLLLSCVGGASHVTRLCPCRKYRRGQVALCVDCIR